MQATHFTTLIDPTETQEPISGVSGLIKHGDYYFAIRDNSKSLYQFAAKDFKLINKIPIFEGRLPAKQKARKKVKPDLEAQVLLTPNTLLLIPSGSKKNRIRGALLQFTAPGELAKEILPVDFSSLYEALLPDLKKVNIEGAAVVGKKMLLFHRGNSKKSKNAIVHLNLDCIYSNTNKIDFHPKCIEKITYPKLGGVGFIPYTFTDALAISSSEVLFLAASEETDNAYFDGDVSGVAIGMVNQDGEVQWIKPLEQKIKFEGLALASEANTKTIDLYLVSDADSDKTPSDIYRLVIAK